jgi:hypothetical protein
VFSERPETKARFDMTILIALLVAALVFGVGAVLEGLAWAMIIAIALVFAAVIVGAQVLGRGRRRTSTTA